MGHISPSQDHLLSTSMKKGKGNKVNSIYVFIRKFGHDPKTVYQGIPTETVMKRRPRYVVAKPAPHITVKSFPSKQLIGICFTDSYGEGWVRL